MFLFNESSVANLLWNLSASFPMVPLVEKTKGTKEAFSTSMTRWLYMRFFSCSCFRNGSATAAFDGANGWNIRTSNRTLSIGLHTPRAAMSSLASSAVVVEQRLNSSPVIGSRCGSVTTSWHTSDSNEASISRICSSKITFFSLSSKKLKISGTN